MFRRTVGFFNKILRAVSVAKEISTGFSNHQLLAAALQGFVRRRWQNFSDRRRRPELKGQYVL